MASDLPDTKEIRILWDRREIRILIKPKLNYLKAKLTLGLLLSWFICFKKLLECKRGKIKQYDINQTHWECKPCVDNNFQSDDGSKLGKLVTI